MQKKYVFLKEVDIAQHMRVWDQSMWKIQKKPGLVSSRNLVLQKSDPGGPDFCNSFLLISQGRIPAQIGPEKKTVGNIHKLDPETSRVEKNESNYLLAKDLSQNKHEKGLVCVFTCRVNFF